MQLAPPDPPLSDGVVTLRPWAAGDIPVLAEACREEEIARWLDQVPQPYTEADARDYVAATRRAWKDGSMATFAVEDAQSARVIGSVGLRFSDPGHGVGEVGYWVSKEARGRGVASRAVRLVSAWALVDCSLARLQLRADDRNIPSQRVAEKVGFTREGVLRSIRYNARLGRRANYVMYSLLPEELR